MPDEPLATRAQDAVASLARAPPQRKVMVLADADVDGVAAAALLAMALHRVGRRFVVRLSRRRDPHFFAELLSDPPDVLITADLGATEVQRFLDARVPTIILDHHVPQKDGDGVGVVHVNPHLEGEDGSRTASGAAVSFVFAEALLAAHDQAAGDLLPLALLGARGDRYHGNAPGGLHARLRARVDDSSEALSWRAGPRLPTGPVGEALASSLDPFVARVAGRPEAAGRALAELGLDADQRTENLDDDAGRVLATWLTLELLEQGALPSAVEDAVAPRLVCGPAGPAGGRAAGRDLDELAGLVDAASRLGLEGDALAALLGLESAWDALVAAGSTYRDTVTAPLASAARGRTKTAGPARLLSIGDGRYSGAVADRVMAWTAAGRDPVVVWGPVHTYHKVSLRARPDGPGWRLDQVAHEAAAHLGGIGGGHRLAAGASIPMDKEEAFLDRVAAGLARTPGSDASVEDGE